MKTWSKGFLYWMTEWWRNEGDFRIRGFALLQKMSLISPSFGHSVSFLNDETDWNEVKRSENDWNALWMISFLCYFSFQPFSNDEGMTEWGEMRVFSEVEKKSEARKTSHSTVILSFQHHSTLMIWNAPLNDTGMIRNGLWMNESGVVSSEETTPDSFI